MLYISVDLLGLLKWQEILNDTTSLKKHLENLMKVQGEEIVKVRQDLCALSFIWHSYYVIFWFISLNFLPICCLLFGWMVCFMFYIICC